MTTHDTAISAHHRQASGFADASSLAGRVLSALSKLRDGIAARRQERRDIRELRSLSDETLRDIGVSRSEIVGLVTHEQYGLVDHRHADF